MTSMPKTAAQGQPSDASLPLEGIRVIELGNYIAAPTAGRLMSDFGAEVIKIERPSTGDELRNWRLYEGDTSMLYRTINRGKKSVELDLRTEEGQAAILALVSCSDVLIENFRPGTMDGWGLTADALTEANPELVVARVSAFGQTGPLASQPGFAAVAEAYGGLRDLVGESDRPPSRVGVSIGDSIAGLYAAFGVVMALFDRQTRQGQDTAPWRPNERHIDVALHEAVFSMMESLLPDYSAHGRWRNRLPPGIPGSPGTPTDRRDRDERRAAARRHPDARWPPHLPCLAQQVPPPAPQTAWWRWSSARVAPRSPQWRRRDRSAGRRRRD